jgi:hypothetical protein
VIVFVIPRNPIGKVKMARHIIKKIGVFSHHAERDNITCKYKDIPLRSERSDPQELLILREFKMQVRCILQLHVAKIISANLL